MLTLIEMVQQMYSSPLYKRKMVFRDCNNKAVVIRTKMFLGKKNVNFTKTETQMGHLLLMY